MEKELCLVEEVVVNTPKRLINLCLYELDLASALILDVEMARLVYLKDKKNMTVDGIVKEDLECWMGGVVAIAEVQLGDGPDLFNLLNDLNKKKPFKYLNGFC
ncbi:MAG: hypothetical protein HRT66_11655 [Flavobacteriaceae bacterium]|nr:hypothetical protein [Flavobacteriaceae bacterium]